MEKDYCEEIRRRLSDVPAGRCLAIRCPLGRNEIVRTFEDQRLPLIRGSRPSPMNCIPESRFPIIILSVISSTFITITGSLSWRSITAAEAGSAGRWEKVSACISEKGISPST